MAGFLQGVRKLGRLLAFLAAFLLIIVVVVGMSALWRQHQRDERCRTQIAWTTARIEQLRHKLGRLPSAAELPPELYSHDLSQYVSWQDDPARLRALGARDGQDYMFTIWRSERHVEHRSWSPEDNCDSGVSQLFMWSLAIIALPLVLMFWRDRRARPTRPDTSRM